MKEVHAIFKGRVQGVGFRATAQHIAKQLGLHGTVQNLSDGTVEIYAQGNQETLNQFLDTLKARFRDSKISLITFNDPAKAFSTFHILMD